MEHIAGCYSANYESGITTVVGCNGGLLGTYCHNTKKWLTLQAEEYHAMPAYVASWVKLSR